MSYQQQGSSGQQIPGQLGQQFGQQAGTGGSFVPPGSLPQSLQPGTTSTSTYDASSHDTVRTQATTAPTAAQSLGQQGGMIEQQPQPQQPLSGQSGGIGGLGSSAGESSQPSHPIAFTDLAAADVAAPGHADAALLHQNELAGVPALPPAAPHSGAHSHRFVH